jgi:glucose-6-phosphate 1-dehydrogenase
MKLFIYGSTGDLVKRKVLLALHELKNLEIFALGRKELTDETYSQNYCEKCSKEFKLRLRYQKIDFDSSLLNQIKDTLDKKDINYFYISMPPEFIKSILNQLSQLKKNGIRIKILIEKPFGHNQKEAKSLKKLILNDDLEKEIFLADHYLFKDSVLELKRNSVNEYKEIKIVSEETLGLENRSYYDDIGALKDMIQSHFLNILFKLISKEDIISKWAIQEFKRGQYKDYQKELGKESKTETFVELKFKTKSGKEIEFITGKKMPKAESYLELDKIRIELSKDKNPYINMFEAFLQGNRENFPSMDNSIAAWKIIEDLEKNKPKITIY